MARNPGFALQATIEKATQAAAAVTSANVAAAAATMTTAPPPTPQEPAGAATQGAPADGPAESQPKDQRRGRS